MLKTKFSLLAWLKEPDSIFAYLAIIVITLLALYGFYKFCQWALNYAKHYDDHHKNRFKH